MKHTKIATQAIKSIAPSFLKCGVLPYTTYTFKQALTYVLSRADRELTQEEHTALIKYLLTKKSWLQSELDKLAG